MPSVARSGFPKDFFNPRSRRGSLTNQEKVNLGANLQSSDDQGDWRDICDFDSCLPPTSELLRKQQFQAIPAEQSQAFVTKRNLVKLAPLHKQANPNMTFNMNMLQEVSSASIRVALPEQSVFSKNHSKKSFDAIVRKSDLETRFLKEQTPILRFDAQKYAK
jgi:hypothetical protein